MTLESSEKVLKKLGFKYEPEVLPLIRQTIDKSSIGSELSKSDKGVIKSIILTKASDLAISKGRTNVSKRDVNRVIELCTFLTACLKSSILSNPHISAVTLSATDVATLHSIGISNNAEMAKISVSGLVDKSVKHAEQSTKSKVPLAKKHLFAKRAQLWSYQAKLLSSRKKAS